MNGPFGADIADHRQLPLDTTPTRSRPPQSIYPTATAERSSAVARRRCQQALEIDGRTHDHTADEWLPAVYDIAAALLEAARLDREPPSLVEHAEQAVSWLSRAIVDLDRRCA